eukprot:CAMPEP_0194194900 /NCGR_PEP_ID=MMETSP0154-20130528/75835_1 /TAXON_ID=1049557 /ORGANISM="Thalassiothrix antarctica, Strain L6-D1" /LENGTH=1157 /DNA_ID=CAMNT_0038919369 /DNA_START=311 /DNA_END=3780 /DNA_ORIENTATION=-
MVKLMSPPGFVKDATKFEDLPLKLRAGFNLLACLCTLDGGNNDCCLGKAAHISLLGIDNPTPAQSIYFFTVCLTTERRIVDVMGTDAPTKSPFPSFAPTATPSYPPSVSPLLAPVILSPPPTAPVTPIPTSTAPATETPTTPAPVTQAPTSPAPATQAPTSPAPATQAPTSPAPVTPDPVTPDPVTPAPVTPAPVTQTPSTPTPVTQEPTIPEPVTPFPIILSPITPFPVTMSPIISSPVTPAPITPAPDTPAPVIPTPILPESMIPSLLTPAPVITEQSHSPTRTPSEVPTLESTSELPLLITYEVGYKEGYKEVQLETYKKELTTSMDTLARQVIYNGKFRKQRRQRKLETEVSGSGILSFLEGLPSADACPKAVKTVVESAECATLQHSLTLITDDEDPTLIENEFVGMLNASIGEGKLQKVLNEQYPQSSIFIITGYVNGTVPGVFAPSVEERRTVKTGATAGIAIGAIIVVMAAAVLIYTYRRGADEKEEETYFPSAQRELATCDPAEDIVPQNPENLMLGANQPEYRITRKASQQATKTLAEEEQSNMTMKHADVVDSSSNAGSSGWSSSAGFSSLNTGSIDSMDIVDKDGMPGTRLSTIGAQSAMAAGRSSKDDSRDVPDVPNVTREDLDSAIESGDWAAVGATAALLAAASDSQSYSSRSRRTDTSISRGGSSVSSLDAARAAELNHLVEAGNWEGVVVAAAKFEASEDTSTGGSKGSRGSRGTNTAGGSSGYGSQSGSLSESPSKAAKRDEIRSEVKSLVRRVVPEKIDNVDEMMLQFTGREEELVETLRTMQERQVAQKARVQGQKQAKRDARQTAREGGIVLPSPPHTKPNEESGVSSSVVSSVSSNDPLATPLLRASKGISAAAAGIGVGVAAATGIAAAVDVGEADSCSTSISETASSDCGNGDSDSDGVEGNFVQNAGVPSILGDEESKTASSTGDSEFSSSKRRTALELAIEAGDWEAVGEAAAMMSDASVTTADTLEINRIAEQGESSTFSGDNMYKVNAQRASELDEMIDAGNWSAVVAAASRFGSADSRAVSDSPQDIAKSVDDSVAFSSQSSEVHKGSIIMEGQEKGIKEEQDALAQAEIWTAIAKQSKIEGATDAAASNAADWAIARSLSALKKAEQKGDLEGNQGSDDSQDRRESG